MAFVAIYVCVCKPLGGWHSYIEVRLRPSVKPTLAAKGCQHSHIQKLSKKNMSDQMVGMYKTLWQEVEMTDWCLGVPRDA
jgi:hypothetical protein